MTDQRLISFVDWYRWRDGKTALYIHRCIIYTV